MEREDLKTQRCSLQRGKRVCINMEANRNSILHNVLVENSPLISPPQYQYHILGRWVNLIMCSANLEQNKDIFVFYWST